MPYPLAKLGTYTLPDCFKYIPYVPKKRFSVTKTANAVVTQVAFPTQIIHGDGLIYWTLEVGYPTEFEDLYKLYDTAGLVTYDFDGYWNDYYTVYFSEYKVEKVHGRLFIIHGEFQIVTVRTFPIYDALTCAP